MNSTEYNTIHYYNDVILPSGKYVKLLPIPQQIENSVPLSIKKWKEHGKGQ